MAYSEPSLPLIGLMTDGQSAVLQMRSLPEEIVNSKFFFVTRAMQVFSEPLINDSWKVVGSLGARRCLPVRVGRSSSAGQSAGLLRLAFFVEAFRVVAIGAGLVDVAEPVGSTADGVFMAVSIGRGDAELSDVSPATVGGGFACPAELLLALLMINATATASTAVAPNTTPRRAQYICAGSGPTGCSMLMQASLGILRRPESEPRRPLAGSRAAVLRRSEGTCFRPRATTKQADSARSAAIRMARRCPGRATSRHALRLRA